MTKCRGESQIFRTRTGFLYVPIVDGESGWVRVTADLKTGDQTHYRLVDGVWKRSPCCMGRFRWLLWRFRILG